MKKNFSLFLLSLSIFSLLANENLLNNRWEVTKINTIYTDTEEKPFIIFDTQTLKIKGFTGCNNFFGSFTIKNGALKFSALASTRMLCTEKTMKIESEFLKTLSLVKSYKIKNKSLYLYNKRKKSLLQFKLLKP